MRDAIHHYFEWGEQVISHASLFQNINIQFVDFHITLEIEHNDLKIHVKGIQIGVNDKFTRLDIEILYTETSFVSAAWTAFL